ncbi:hypothetical protein A9Q78_07875 [Methylophaga sp. 41_12_T18]|nr:hypothetical protein A9Q78_07875 [Methylophaga sp. 41_12_T18]
MKKNKLSLLLSTAVLITSSFVTVSNASEWQLNPSQSQLNFISIKKSHVAEVHKFTDIQGQLTEQGQFYLAIDLASVDTNIEIRNERMKTHLFEIEQFATANLTATIDLEKVDAIAEGASAAMIIDAELDLHGFKQPVSLDLIVTRLVGAKISVVSSQPILVRADDFSLVAGINKLRDLAKLPSIGYTVPVSFYLIFNHKQK